VSVVFLVLFMCVQKLQLNVVRVSPYTTQTPWLTALTEPTTSANCSAICLPFMHLIRADSCRSVNLTVSLKNNRPVAVCRPDGWTDFTVAVLSLKCMTQWCLRRILDIR